VSETKPHVKMKEIAVGAQHRGQFQAKEMPTCESLPYRKLFTTVIDAGFVPASNGDPASGVSEPAILSMANPEMSLVSRFETHKKLFDRSIVSEEAAETGPNGELGRSFK
jgi:hypothetical protein